MAIYHLAAKVISRGKGKCATASSAYQAAEKIKDLRTGQIYDYTRKQGVDATEIIAPENAPDWVENRSELWNNAELFENRKNSRTAREIELALPVELNSAANQELVRGFVKEELISKNLVADLAFHNLDSHNPHAHIMFSTRVIGEKGWGIKQRSLDQKEWIRQIRASWANHVNQALEQAGQSERIDHRSLEAQGINRIPQIHLGANVAAMMKKGIATERGEIYLEIEAANQEIEELELDFKVNEKLIEYEQRKIQQNQPPQHPPPVPVVNISISTSCSDKKLFSLEEEWEKWQKENEKQIKELQQQQEKINAEIEQLRKSASKLNSKLIVQQQKLAQMKPRSLLNPFGATCEEIQTLEEAITKKQTKLDYAQKKYQHYRNQKKEIEKKYQAWLNSPENQEMREYGELRQTPEMSHRIQALADTPQIYQLAQSILAQEGETTNNVRRVENKEYRLAQTGKTISIFKKYTKEIIYQATDERETRGRIKMVVFKMNQRDKNEMRDAHYLGFKPKQKDKSRGIER